MREVFDRIDEILATAPVARDAGKDIGRSREGRPIRAFRMGSGSQRVSLLAGAHADEPVGPRFLRHLAGYLAALPADDPLLVAYEWWIVPHINPDGEERNRRWHRDDDQSYDLIRYLTHVVRELPGDDIEFGFPHDAADQEARPENRAAYGWWRQANGPFSLHVSLHGMAFAAGPWFLIDADWKDRCDRLKRNCTGRVRELGYVLHDVERNGEKGFIRLGRGFCTRPDSRAMRRHFMDLGDEAAAQRFRPSSMETIRSLGGDALTLVSEMPLFITPGVGEQLGPPDPLAEEWKARLDSGRARLHQGACAAAPAEILAQASVHGLAPMPVGDQMRLQWALIAEGIAQVQAERSRRTGP